MAGKEYLKTMLQLATTAFGLVAALAWNEAIKALFQEVFGSTSNIIGLFVYAIAVTVIVVAVTTRLAKLAEKAGIQEQKNSSK
ncbi:MAG: DUF5654 family protein [Patescibacteria group bacterium]